MSLADNSGRPEGWFIIYRDNLVRKKNKDSDWASWFSHKTATETPQLFGENNLCISFLNEIVFKLKFTW